MRRGDVDVVARIESESFPTPWNRGHFLHEITRNPYSLNLVLRRDGSLVGYASVWLIDAELQVNKIAIRTDERGLGLGRFLMDRLIGLATREGCSCVTLEVRPANAAARALYAALGFTESGRRRDYYGPGEDGILLRLELPDPPSERCCSPRGEV